MDWLIDRSIDAVQPCRGAGYKKIEGGTSHQGQCGKGLLKKSYEAANKNSATLEEKFHQTAKE